MINLAQFPYKNPCGTDGKKKVNCLTSIDQFDSRELFLFLPPSKHIAIKDIIQDFQQNACLKLDLYLLEVLR